MRNFVSSLHYFYYKLKVLNPSMSLLRERGVIMSSSLVYEIGFTDLFSPKDPRLGSLDKLFEGVL